MRRALDLARSVLGRTSPNPAVGAVVLYDDQIVGEGATRPPGGDHAEVVALRAAGSRARGATLLVTLEPCNHVGRTPACTTAILRAGIARVVVAVRDPNPGVRGAALEHLRSHGVEVATGLEREAASELNFGFFKLAANGRPFVTLKWAMTLDGKIAGPAGGGAITGRRARAEVHALRDASDAILIGSGTARIDDPRLTVRPAPPDGRQPVRVVLDSGATLAPRARMLREPGQTLVIATAAASAARRRALGAAGADVLVSAADQAGRVDPDAMLRELGARGLTSVLVEGGARVHAAFLDAGVVDRVVVFVAPHIMGAGVAAIAERAAEPHGAPVSLDDATVRTLGPDVMIAGYLNRYDPAVN